MAIPQDPAGGSARHPTHYASIASITNPLRTHRARDRIALTQLVAIATFMVNDLPTVHLPPLNALMAINQGQAADLIPIKSCGVVSASLELFRGLPTAGPGQDPARRLATASKVTTRGLWRRIETSGRPSCPCRRDGRGLSAERTLWSGAGSLTAEHGELRHLRGKQPLDGTATRRLKVPVEQQPETANVL
jgi:hypothetical protein